MRCCYTPSRLTKRKKMDNTQWRWGCKATGISKHVPVGALIYSTASENFLAVTLLIRTYALRSNTFILKYTPHKNADMCAPKTWAWIFKTALFTVTQHWKQPKCPSTVKWLNKVYNTWWAIVSINENEQTTTAHSNIGKFHKNNVE